MNVFRVVIGSMLLVGFFSGVLYAKNEPTILIVNSYHYGEEWSDNELEGILTELKGHYPNIVPLVENIDAKRFPGPEHALFYKDYLIQKYQDKKIDLIIALDNPALDLLVSCRAKFKTDVPIVFAGVNGYIPDMLANDPLITGIAEVQDIEGTLNIAFSLHTSIRYVYVIHDYTSSGYAVRKDIERLIPSFPDAIQFTFSQNVPCEEMLKTLRALTPDTIVLLLTYVTDSKGKTFTRAESTKIITAASPVPVYANHITRLGHGIVGGLLLSGEEHGRQAARMGLRILHGEPIATIPVDMKSTSLPYFDYEQLKRFSIDEASLPVGSTVINKNLSYFERYRGIIVTTAIIFVCLLSTIIVLVWATIRQRHAAHEIQRSQELFESIANTSPALIWLSGTDKLCTWFNKPWLSFRGRTLQEEQGNGWIEGVHPDDRTYCVDIYTTAFDQRKPFAMEYRLQRADGEYRWIFDAGHPRFSHQKVFLGYIGTCIDVTEKKHVEDELRRSELRFRELFDRAPISYQSLDENGRFLDVNQTWLMKMGYEYKEVVGKWFGDFISHEGRIAFGERFPCFKSLGQVCGVEFMMVRKDGSQFLASYEGRIGYDEQGKFKQTHCIFFDITQQRHMEMVKDAALESLRKSETLLRNIIDTSRDLIFVKDTSLRTMLCNKAFSSFVGKEPEDLIGRTDIENGWAPELVKGNPEQGIRGYEADDLEALQGHLVTNFEDIARRGAQSIVFDTVKVPIRDEAGRIMGVLGVSRDITERKKSDELLRASEVRFKTLVENIPGVTYRCAYDRDWTIEYFSDGIQHLSGYPVSDFMNNRVRSYGSIIHKDDADAIYSIVSECIQQKKPYELEYRIMHASGDIRWVIERGQGIFDDAGELKYLDGVIFDITEKKKAENELKELKDHLQEQVHVQMKALHEAQARLVRSERLAAMGELGGTIAHEFRNQLGVMRNIGYLLRMKLKDHSDSAIQKHLGILETQIVQTDAIIENILTFVRTKTPSFGKVNMRALLSRLIDMIRIKQDAVTIETHFDDELPDSIIADEVQLIQVFNNIMINAVEAMATTKNGVLSVTVKADKERVHVILHDNGCGMAEDVKKRLFTPLFSTKARGAGLGLSTAKILIEGHGGAIHIDSELTKGTAVTIMLPVRGAQG